MSHRRLYHSGSRWALWRWTYTPSGYITRLHLIQTPLGAVCLHWINEPDEEPWLHDHPVSFIRIVLRRWYTEQRWKPRWNAPQWRAVRWIGFIRASKEDVHRIRWVAPGGCLTLCLMGPKVRDWGFHTDEGWIGWREYNERKYKNHPPR